MAEVGICGKGNLLIYVCFQIIIIIPPNYGDINQSPPDETPDPRSRNSSLGASSLLPGVTTLGIQDLRIYSVLPRQRKEIGPISQN